MNVNVKNFLINIQQRHVSRQSTTVTSVRLNKVKNYLQHNNTSHNRKITAYEAWSISWVKKYILAKSLLL